MEIDSEKVDSFIQWAEQDGAVLLEPAAIAAQAKDTEEVNKTIDETFTKFKEKLSEVMPVYSADWGFKLDEYPKVVMDIAGLNDGTKELALVLIERTKDNQKFQVVEKLRMNTKDMKYRTETSKGEIIIDRYKIIRSEELKALLVAVPRSTIPDGLTPRELQRIAYNLLTNDPSAEQIIKHMEENELKLNLYRVDDNEFNALLED